MATMMDRKLGELLVKDNLITSVDLETALERQKTGKGSLGHFLTEMDVVKEWEIAAALGKHLNVPFITLSQYEIDQDVLRSIPRDIVKKYHIVPVDRTGDVLTVALSDPSNIYVLDELRLLTKCQIVPVISFETDIRDAIDQYYSEDSAASSQLEEMLKEINDQNLEIIHEGGEEDIDMSMVDEAPVVNLVNAIIQEAIRQNASDIHFEPLERTMRLRYRLDGVLQERPAPPKKFQNAVISRIKIMSEMDIAEKRLPQDGRFKIRFEGNRPIDFRVNSLPTAHGEKIVIRILDQSNLMTDLTSLGFEAEELKRFEPQIRKPWGMILVTGPTGSGKSTTLYSAISTINDVGKNIMTIENPIEYQLHGINQVLARPDIGLTFAAALRSFLRQDPDIIMVGEIRDMETAEIAIHSALTGHLVLSTLHTNDAPSSVNRLTNMGIEPFMVTAALNMVVAQRLVRRICKTCSTTYRPGRDQREAIGLIDNDIEFRRGRGCNACSGTGYKGRVALYEIMVVSDAMREMIINGVSVSKLKQKAIEEGMRTLRMSGAQKIAEGTTTIEEVLSTTVGDEA